MNIPQTELFGVLQEFNPWWNGQPTGDLPTWQRAAARPVWSWVQNWETPRSLLLAGARQTGKTTLFRQTIRRLLQEGFPAARILYATFDHPLLKLAGLPRTLQAWDALFPREGDQPRFLFLDEIQYVPDWQVWVKHQVDFHRRQRIAATGSATPLVQAGHESGVGRWETIPLATMSFPEFLRLRGLELAPVPQIDSLLPLFDWQPADFARTAVGARALEPHFHDYLLRGGFPEPALASDLTRTQRLLREDIVDKVLKRDMTALYGVRRVLELEKIFLYLCYHDGGILDLATLTRELDGVNKQSAINFLDLLEATHLIYRLKPFGYGKEVLRGRDKVYLADAALPGAMLLRGRRLLDRPDLLGTAVETAVFTHLFTRYYAQTPTFSYWRDKRNADLEVDIIAELGERLVPFEVKYQDTAVTARKLKGLRLFLEAREQHQGYVVTRRWEDFGVLDLQSAQPGHERRKMPAKALAIPAPLACYWLAGR